MENNLSPPNCYNQLSQDEIFSKLEEGKTVYILFWCGMSDIDERALKYQQDAEGKIKVWCNTGNDIIFELDYDKSRTAYEAITLNGYELTEDEFIHFSKLKKTFYK